MRGTSTITGGSANKANRPDLWNTVLISAVFFVYLCMVSRSAMPGRSSDLIAKALDLEPRLAPASSLWFLLTHPLTLLPQPVLALNLFSLVCAVACVYLTGWLLQQVVLTRCDEKLISQEEGRTLARIAALTGSAALAFSPPFWSAALRADTGTLNCLLLVTWFVFVFRFAVTLRTRWAFAVMLWGGLGASQSVAFFWLTPVALFGCLRMLFRARRLSFKLATQLIASLLLPYSVIIISQSASFLGTEGHRLTGSLPLWRVVAELMWGQILLMRLGVTTEGWLLGFVTVIAPWLVCAGLLVWPQKTRVSRQWEPLSDHPVLHGLAALAAVGIFLDAPFSMWSLHGEQFPWLTPVVLSALTSGWVAAYGYRAAMQHPKWNLWKRPSIVVHMPYAVLALVALILVKGLVSNGSEASALLRSVVSSYVSKMVDATGTRPWLLTGGSLDSMILIDAHQKGLALNVLNVTRMSDEMYRDYMAGKFSDPQLANACRIGMNPLVREWFGNGTNLSGQVAILALPDLWYAAGLQPEPNSLVFVGDDASGSPGATPEEVWARNVEGWNQMEPLIESRKSDPPAVAAFRAHARRHVSFVANNAGVWLEDHGRPALAGQAYVRARKYEPYNVSALLNLGALVRQGVVTNDAPAILAEMKTLVEAKPNLQWWSLTRRYGYVRQADAYAAMGHVWALSGQPGITAAGLNRSLTLSSDAKKTDSQEAILAQVCLEEGRLEESRAIYERQLAARPDDVRVLIGLAQLALATNDTASACVWLRRADKPGQLKEGLDLVVAGLYSRAGDLGRARVLAQAALDRSNDDLAAWALMAGVALGQRDTKMVDLCLREIRRLEKGRKFNGIVVEALQALDKGAAPQARTLFDEALRHRAKSVEVMERILRLDLLLGIREKTADMARFLILLDSRSALAHYILGVIHLRANAWADARPWLEQSVALSPAPEAFNDLAWVLLQQGELTLAEQRASEAVKRMPTFGAAWDTLGMTLIAAGRHEEAVKALERAIACGGGRSPTLLAHLARARIGQGDKPEALLLLQEAVSIKRALIPPEEEEIRAVRQLIKVK